MLSSNILLDRGNAPDTERELRNRRPPVKNRIALRLFGQIVTESGMLDILQDPSCVPSFF